MTLDQILVLTLILLAHFGGLVYCCVFDPAGKAD